MCMSCMDLGWGLIVKNRSEMNVNICSVTFKLIHVCCLFSCVRYYVGNLEPNDANLFL